MRNNSIRSALLIRPYCMWRNKKPPYPHRANRGGNNLFPFGTPANTGSIRLLFHYEYTPDQWYLSREIFAANRPARHHQIVPIKKPASMGGRPYPDVHRETLQRREVFRRTFVLRIRYDMSIWLSKGNFASPVRKNQERRDTTPLFPQTYRDSFLSRGLRTVRLFLVMFCSTIPCGEPPHDDKTYR